VHLIARIVVVTLVGIAGDAWTARAQEGSGGAAERGKAAYMKAGCYACHGTVGQGGPGGRLAPKPVPQAAFTSFVRKGKVANARVNRNWAGMPPYSAKFLSDAEVADIYAYLSSIPDPPAVSSLPLLSSR
jgi:ubiquinol-cytochrome c reductase cytochrome c subunit